MNVQIWLNLSGKILITKKMRNINYQYDYQSNKIMIILKRILWNLR